MTLFPVRVASAMALLMLVGACAATAGGGAAPGGPASPEPEPAPATVVLQVGEVGAVTTPALLAGRLPTATVYADGRLITDGPVIAIWPPPALPNLQVYQLDDGGLRDLVDRALAAGVAGSGDLGDPPVADATSTRFTLRTGGETVTREVYALGLGPADLPPGDEPSPRAEDTFGLTEDQAAARARLSDLVKALRNPVEALGAERVTGPEPYTPEAVAALAGPYVDPDPQLVQPEQPWPGPALPGEPIAPGVTCVTARGEQAQAVLGAAGSASAATPWTSADGTRWSVVLRPLLPHESGCADLTG